MKLSKREQEVLSYLPHGLTDKEIAIKLGISKRTVQTYINRVFIKLGVRNRVGAACVFVQHNNINSTLDPKLNPQLDSNLNIDSNSNTELDPNI